MRQLACVLALATVLGCASTDSAPSLDQTCEDRYSQVFASAQRAVIALGGDVMSASEASGLILGKLPVDVFGSVVQLDISLRRMPGRQPGQPEPVTVNVRASEPGAKEITPERRQELISLEERYLALVAGGADCGAPMGAR